ncbi:ran-binding protein [Rutstroemia sp. NJR-2017a BBW]|nr:ran-binding protein [Rutstroemia sp. NJR-2017a BBW]
MDNSLRANAAQLAARSIKAKPKRPIRSGGALAAPVSSDNSGGGLFGGSVQSPGSFNFSAPTPAGISFPSPFGGFSGNQGSSDNEDPRADTTGEEEKRRSMKFGSSSADGSSVPLFAPNLNASFSANQTPNLFGGATNTQPTPAVGGFGFGSSTQNSASSGNSGINFGATAPASSGNTPFSFGATTSQGGANNNVPAFGGFGGTNSPSISEAPKTAITTTKQPFQLFTRYSGNFCKYPWF